MVDTRQTVRGPQREAIAQEKERVDAESNQIDADRKLFEDVVRLRRSFPSVSVEEVKDVIKQSGLDSKKAAVILHERQPIVVEEEAEANPNGPPKTPASSTRRLTVLKRPAPSLSNPHSTSVKIQVGKDVKNTWIVHKDFICHASPYFDRAFNSNELFVERETQFMNFNHTSSDIFGIFVKWIYNTRTIKDENKQYPSVPQLVKLWVLGEKINTPALQNHAIRGLFGNRFCDGSDGIPIPRGFIYIYNNTVPGSALRRLFIDWVMDSNMSYRDLKDIMDNHWDELPQEMIKDLLLALKRSSKAAKDGKLSPPKVEDYLVKV